VIAFSDLSVIGRALMGREMAPAFILFGCSIEQNQPGSSLSAACKGHARFIVSKRVSCQLAAFAAGPRKLDRRLRPSLSRNPSRSNKY
jgi:hypothetical protein